MRWAGGGVGGGYSIREISQKIYQGIKWHQKMAFPLQGRVNKTREGKWDEWWCKRTVGQGLFFLMVSHSQERL